MKPEIHLTAWFKAIFSWFRSCFNKSAGETPRKRLTPQMLNQLKEISQKLLLERREREAAAHAAAIAGEGPQPWDRDWFERDEDISEEIIDLAPSAGWHWVQDFIEVLDWALASPQGQRAQALVNDSANPGQGPLELINQLRSTLVFCSHQLLKDQAEALDYSEDWMAALEQGLDQLSGSKQTL